LSWLYLIRHGQAGLRHDYDTLSDLGRKQARLLGEHLAGQQVRFTAAYSGALKRQRETAAAVLGAMAVPGVEIPELRIDEHWSEFDLDSVYQSIAPLLAKDDADFRMEHEKLRRSLQEQDSAVHRTWARSDTLVVRAWVEGRYNVPCESWEAFRRRVSAPLEALTRRPAEDTVAIFSSATPIAVWVGLALELTGRHVLRLAGATYNTAVTTVRAREGDLALFSFNGTAHLPEPHLRTFR
jgi:broad specificity phosphatase PhoE